MKTQPVYVLEIRAQRYTEGRIRYIYKFGNTKPGDIDTDYNNWIKAEISVVVCKGINNPVAEMFQEAFDEERMVTIACDW